MADLVLDETNLADRVTCTCCGKGRPRCEFLPVPVIVRRGAARSVEIHSSFLCADCRRRPPKAKSTHANGKAAKFFRTHQKRVTPDEWENAYALQNGRCGNCGRLGHPMPERLRPDQTESEGRIRLVADVDPVTHLIRGLLCVTCDKALHSLGDTLAAVEKLVAYLKREKSEQLNLIIAKENSSGEDEGHSPETVGEPVGTGSDDSSGAYTWQSDIEGG
jgi:hypothetical protein